MSIAGRLAEFMNNWSKITTDSVILSAISGYKIPFFQSPPSRPCLQEPRLSRMEQSFCKKEIERLLDKGALHHVNFDPEQYLSSYFLVNKSSGGKRFILNLKPLNKFVTAPHFKMEDLSTATKLISPNSFMATIDLEDSYLLVPIHASHRKYLRFLFRGEIFEFTAMPFGLSSAPYIFTKIMRTVVAALRERGFLSVIYLDDFLLFGDSLKDCSINVRETLLLLDNLGFIINKEKCELIPSQERKYLGFILNSSEMSISLPEDKRSTLIDRLERFSTKRSCKIRDFASLIGSLNSICRTISYGTIYIRDFERQKFLACLESNDDYDSQMSLPSSLHSDFEWWLTRLRTPPISRPLQGRDFAHEIFSDASPTGWGASMDENRTHGWWSSEERGEHINFLELKAVEYALKSFVSNARSQDLLLRIDNTTAIAYINKGGSSQFPKLSALAKSIWQWCETRDLYLFASYIRSADNVTADAESRIVSTETEWEITSPFFEKIFDRFGPFNIDLFATHTNAKCEIFVSWFPDPFATAVDAFTINWNKYYFYAFPPFALITRVLRKIINDRAEGVLIVPRWPAQPWFPLFNKLCISDLLVFDPDPNLLTSPFRNRHPTWHNISLVVGKLSAKRFAERGFRRNPQK